MVKEPRSLAVDKLDLCCDKPKIATTRIQQSSTHKANSKDGFPWATSSYTDPAVGALGSTASYIHTGDRVGSSPGPTLSYSNVAGSSGLSAGAAASHSVTTNSIGGSVGANASYSHTGDEVRGSFGPTLPYINVAGPSLSSPGATSSPSFTASSIGGSLGATSPYSNIYDTSAGSPSTHNNARDQTFGSSSLARLFDSHTIDSTGGALSATVYNSNSAGPIGDSSWATSFSSQITDQAIGSSKTAETVLHTNVPIAGSGGATSSHSLAVDQTGGSHGATSPYGRSIDLERGSPRATLSSDDPRITTATVVATESWPPNDKMAATNYYLRVNKIPVAKERRLFKKAETPTTAVELPYKQSGLASKTLTNRAEIKLFKRRMRMVSWPQYSSPDSNYPLFTKVFGFPIFGVREFTSEYFQRVASTIAELLDNDQDGCLDTPEVVKAMIKSKYALACLVERHPSNQPGLIGPYKIGISILKEEVKLDCSPKSRSSISSDSEICFDKTYKETFNFIYKFGYATAFPQTFGNNFNKLSKLNKAMDKARGGRFYKVPELYPSKAWFTNYDTGCRYSCQVSEYIWFGIASYSNALARQNFMKKEWKFDCRDKLRKGDALLTGIIEETRTYRLPIRRPTGRYFGSKECLIHGQDGPIAQD